MNPVARKEGLLMQQVDGDLTVYDQERSLAHNLNRTASLVFQKADGTRSVADLVALLQEELNPEVDEDLVLLALDQLRRAHLLEEGGDRPAEARRASRRRFVRKVGMIGALSLLLPVVETITAPTPSQAQTGEPCQTPTGTSSPPLWIASRGKPASSCIFTTSFTTCSMNA